MIPEIRNILFSKVNIASVSALAGVHTFSDIIASIDAFCASTAHIASMAVVVSVLIYNVLKIIYYKDDNTKP